MLFPHVGNCYALLMQSPYIINQLYFCGIFLHANFSLVKILVKFYVIYIISLIVYSFSLLSTTVKTSGSGGNSGAGFVSVTFIIVSLHYVQSFARHKAKCKMSGEISGQRKKLVSNYNCEHLL